MAVGSGKWSPAPAHAPGQADGDRLARAQRHGLTAAQQIELDSAADAQARLSRFNLCIRRLSISDQILLLLKDKYGVPMPEIAIATNTPEESLKVQRAQILRSLEEWIWSTS